MEGLAFTLFLVVIAMAKENREKNREIKKLNSYIREHKLSGYIK